MPTAPGGTFDDTLCECGIAYVQHKRLAAGRVEVGLHFSRIASRNDITNLGQALNQLWRTFGWKLTPAQPRRQTRGLLEPTSLLTYHTVPLKGAEQVVLSDERLNQLAPSLYAMRTSLSTVQVTPIPSKALCMIRFTVVEGSGLPSFDRIRIRSDELRAAKAHRWGVDDQQSKVFMVQAHGTDKNLPRLIDLIGLECGSWPTEAQLNASDTVH